MLLQKFIARKNIARQIDEKLAYGSKVKNPLMQNKAIKS